MLKTGVMLAGMALAASAADHATPYMHP